jgi:general secretion pathway protein G
MAHRKLAIAPIFKGWGPIRFKKGQVFMNTNRRRSAFTLIEVLIVVVIMALLAATIIPQFSSSTTDAKKSSLDFNVHTMRSLIQMFQAQHNGKLPTNTEASSFADQMTKKTDLDGTGNATGGKYGPYVTGQLPNNPYNNNNSVAVYTATTLGAVPPGSADSGASGWQYDSRDGSFYPNHSGYNFTTGETAP